MMLPCPFCNSDQVYVGRGGDKYFGTCSSCLASGPQRFNREEALERWNRHADVMAKRIAAELEHEMQPCEVFDTRGQSLILSYTAPNLEDALAYIRQHKGEAAFGIKYLDGTWHNFI